MILAHRGYSKKFKENTLLAFRKAFEFGADGIELDLRVTKDGTAVVIHDENLESFCGAQKKVRELTLQELREFVSNGERVPTFEEVLKIMPRGKLLNAEFKEREVSEQAISLIRKYDLVMETVVSSFDHQLIAELIQKHRDMKFGFLVGEELRNDPIGLIRNLLLYDPYSLHLPHQLADYPSVFSSICNMIKQKNTKIYIWTLDDLEKFERIKDKIDGVITNDVELFVRRTREA